MHPAEQVGSKLFDWKRWKEGILPPLEAHSAAKLQILRDYIEEYIEILCKDTFGKTEFRLTIVDGFAGGGIYQGGELGSPFVLLQAVETAEAKLNLFRTKGMTIDCHFYFVEKEKENFECLVSTLRGSKFGHRIDKSIFLIRGDFQQVQARIVKESRRRYSKGGSRVIFFLDQCGYAEVRAPMLQSIFKQLNWKAEFLLNFAIDWLTPYIGENDVFKRIYPGLGLEEFLPMAQLIAAREKQEYGVPYIIESLIGPALKEATGSPFFSPFFIHKPGSNRGYWLLHLAPFHRARSAMLDVYWRTANGCQHYGHTGMDMLSYKPEANPTGYLEGLQFDVSTRASVKQGLLQDLPKIIREEHTGGVPYGLFLERICNRTLAADSLIRETLTELRHDGEIDASGKQGGAKRSSSINPSDIIRPGASPILLNVPFRPLKKK